MGLATPSTPVASVMGCTALRVHDGSEQRHTHAHVSTGALCMARASPGTPLAARTPEGLELLAADQAAVGCRPVHGRKVGAGFCVRVGLMGLPGGDDCMQDAHTRRTTAGCAQAGWARQPHAMWAPRRAHSCSCQVVVPVGAVVLAVRARAATAPALAPSASLASTAPYVLSSAAGLNVVFLTCRWAWGCRTGVCRRTCACLLAPAHVCGACARTALLLRPTLPSDVFAMSTLVSMDARCVPQRGSASALPAAAGAAQWACSCGCCGTPCVQDTRRSADACAHLRRHCCPWSRVPWCAR